MNTEIPVPVEQKKSEKRRSVFRSAGGASFALITLVIFFGTPAITHAFSFDLFGSFVANAADATLGRLLEALGYIILGFASGILYLIGVLFNFVINETVFAFGTHFGNSPGMLAAWGVLRDISNIGLLFGFVFMGIATILNIHGYEVKKTLPRLIIFAVLLNFSLLAAEAIIDTANIFAVTLYTQSGSTCAATASAEDCAKQQQGNGVSGAIFQASGVSTIFSGAYNQGTDHAKIAVTYLEMAIFVVIISVVLLAGALLLISRAIVLAFLLVLSPIGFAGLAVPFLEGYAKKWWHTLLSQSFFAPVYLLLIFISIKLMQGAFPDKPNLLAALNTGNVGSIEAILIFALLIGFMVAALMAAKQMGAYGASFATGFATKTVSAQFAPMRYMAAFSGRAAANAAGSRAERVYNRFAAGNNVFTRTLKFTGIDEEIAKGISGVKNVKIDGKSYADRQKEREQRGHEIGRAQKQDDLTQALRTISDKKATPTDKTAAQKTIDSLTQKMGMHDLEEVIKNSSDDVVKALGKSMSPEKFEKVMDSKEVAGTKQHLMQEERFAEYKGYDAAKVAALQPNERKDFEKQVRKLTIKDIEQLSKYDPSALEGILEASNDDKLSLFTEDQLEAAQKSNTLSSALRTKVKENTAAGRVEAWIDTSATSPDAVKVIEGMTAKDRMKLKRTVLVKPEIIKTFDFGTLNQLSIDNKLSPAEMKTVRDELKKIPVGDPQRDALDKAFADTALSRSLWNW